VLTHTLIILFQVGHTHNQLDGSFGVLSRHVYGSQRGGVTGIDLLSFSGFDQVSAPIVFLGFEYMYVEYVCVLIVWLWV